VLQGEKVNGVVDQLGRMLMNYLTLVTKRMMNLGRVIQSPLNYMHVGRYICIESIIAINCSHCM